MMIRDATADDLPAQMRLYPLAFPDEDLRPLLCRLASAPDVLSRVALDGPDVVGHLAVTPCLPVGVVLLGPVAIAPRCQRQGLGRRMITDAAALMATRGATQMQVLGDPGYYSRLGFRPDRALAPPYALPRDWDGAWQVMLLTDAPALTGQLQVPAIWADPALWGP